MKEILARDCRTCGMTMSARSRAALDAAAADHEAWHYQQVYDTLVAEGRIVREERNGQIVYSLATPEPVTTETSTRQPNCEPTDAPTLAASGRPKARRRPTT